MILTTQEQKEGRYTRYWVEKSTELPDEFLKEVRVIFEKCENMGIGLGDEYGFGEPTVSKHGICFNAKRYTKFCHYPFRLNADTCPVYDMFYTHNGLNGQCITDKGAYDFAVREILAVAERYGIVTDIRETEPYTRICSDRDELTERGFSQDEIDDMMQTRTLKDEPDEEEER